MVELQIVVLAVAGSSPVGHPIPTEENSSQKSAIRAPAARSAESAFFKARSLFANMGNSVAALRSPNGVEEQSSISCLSHLNP